MHPFRAVALLCALALGAIVWAADPPGLLHIAEPASPSWIKPVPELHIPAPPRDKGLTVSLKKLKVSAPLSFTGNDALAAAAAKPKGVVTGKGTQTSPYVIRNLAIRGLTDTAGLQLVNVTAPLIIENVLIEGIPQGPRIPASAQGIDIDRGSDTIIRHCQVSRCGGIKVANSERMLFEDNFVYSTDTGIFTLQGSHCTARGNYVRDSTRYGVFLYNGPYHIIEHNYVMHTAREGIGTNGNGHHAIYRHNVILHTGWTAINVEGKVDGVVTEHNLVVDTFYGIILLGNNTVTRHNRVYHCSQAGIILIGYKTAEFSNVKIEDNAVYHSGSVGIDVMSYTRDVSVTGNTVWQSGTGISMAATNGIVADNDIYRFMNGINVNAPGCRLTGNKVYRGRNPINLGTSSDTTVARNTIHTALHGVKVGAATNVVVEENAFDLCGGVEFSGSTACVVRKNRITSVPYECLTFINATNCVAEDNVMDIGDQYAIYLTGGAGHLIRNNAISHSRSLWSNGALMLAATRDNTVSGNTFTRNGIAVLLRGGASTGNVFEKNTYIDNGKLLHPTDTLGDFLKHNTVEEALAKQ